ncbi:protein of unknown function [Bradyrhizobium vignae]|uniref:Uncharacterized protein n=1 Tax=Bradyrhizobium vignae TaxID=1549949 RepID=A0A2U3Q107_9BRAD|nr:protein of unknown function [Bradyrhizobium vignae]
MPFARNEAKAALVPEERLPGTDLGMRTSNPPYLA